MSPYFPRPSQVTRRLSPELIETVVSGRVKTSDVSGFLRDFEKLGLAPNWLFDATETTGYEYTAVATAARGFAALHARGLTFAVVAVTNSLVLMGARVVALSAKTEFVFRASVAEARTVLLERKVRMV